jgi:hypothetical protein
MLFLSALQTTISPATSSVKPRPWRVLNWRLRLRPKHAMPGTNFYPCRPSKGPKHLKLFSLTSDPSKPGTGTTLLMNGDPKMHPAFISVARTSPRRDQTVVSPPSLVVCPCPQQALYFWCLVKRSPALQACNRMRNSQADGAPKVPGSGGARLPEPFPLWSPEFMPGKRIGIPR